ncbi:XRE family transcriptional regulator, partial [Deltaproteobacteria bacterium OttesenSCG-928-K17]|nr:XRE family transcriptional regulator [Deltaproteobacteria bacterium OttesenSCG-928-K17]
MDDINNAVADNLKTMREQRKLSLDSLAKMTGVSKSMLAQIERGEANPSISTVWRIANGLKVSFTELVARQEKDFEIVRKSDAPLLTADGGRYRNYPLFPFDGTRKFEIYYIELDPGAFLAAEPHPENTCELITVFSGKLEIGVNNELLTVGKENAVRFRADCPHSYKNTGGSVCKL